MMRITSGERLRNPVALGRPVVTAAMPLMSERSWRHGPLTSHVVGHCGPVGEESEAWRMWDVRNELVATLLLIEMMNHYDAGGRRPECSVAGPLSGWGQRLLESLHLLPPYHFTETGGLDLNQYNMPPPPG